VHRVPSWSRWVPVVAIATAAIALTAPVWTHLDALNETRDRDAQQALSFYYVMVDSVRRHGEYPLWNPYLGGGIPWAGYVQNPALTPVSLPLLAFGEVAGTKVSVISVLLLGGLGAYAAMRGWLAPARYPALVVALVYVASGWIPGRLESGNYSECVYFLLPLLFACQYAYLRARVLGLALPFVYLALLSDAKYGVPLAALAALAVAVGYRHRVALSVPRVALGWAVPFAFGLALGASKILPLAHLLSIDRIEGMSFPHDHFEGLRSLLDHVVGAGEQRPNFKIGIGAPALALAALGVCLRPRRALGLAAVLALLASVMLGPASPVPTHRVLDALPFFHAMKSLVKYLTPATLFVLLALAGIGLDAAWARIAAFPREARVAAGVALAAITVGVPFASAWEGYDGRFTRRPVPVDRAEFHHVAHDSLLGVVERYRYGRRFDEVGQYANMRRNVGTITWYGNMVFGEHAVPKRIWRDRTWQPNPAYDGEVSAANGAPSGCSLPEVRFSYNRIWLAVARDACRSAVLNFEFDPGWTSANAGATVYDAAGRLGVSLRRDAAPEIRLEYRDRRFEVGLAVGALGLLGWGLLGGRIVRGRVPELKRAAAPAGEAAARGDSP